MWENALRQKTILKDAVMLLHLHMKHQFWNTEMLDGQALVRFYKDAPKHFRPFCQYLGPLTIKIGISCENRTAQEILHEIELHKQYSNLMQLEHSKS